MKSFFVFLFCTCITAMLTAQQTFPLYQHIPNSKPSINKEHAKINGGILRISKVSVPELTVYLPAGTSCVKRTAVIICPGGGYGMLAASHEGMDVARVFNEWGIVSFVLKYRLPDDSIMKEKSTGPLQDAQRAIQMVRELAAKWNIDTSKIGIMGFSAGGHLAATASTKFDHAYIDNPAHISLRPDFSILIYPVISFTDSLTHMGSRTNLLGSNHPAAERINEFSAEMQVTTKTPPAFLVHASDDKVVPPMNSVVYYEALLKNHVPADLHIYTKGGHGFGMNNKTTEDKWMQSLQLWMKSNHWLVADKH